MKTPSRAILSLTTITLSLLGIAASHGASYNWDASSGLFPNQVDSRMALSDLSPTFDPVLAGGVLTLQTTGTESMFYLQSAVDLAMPINLVIDFNVRYVSGTTTKPGETHIGIFFNTLDNVGGVVMVRLGSVVSIAPGGATRQTAAAVTNDAFHAYEISVAGTSLGSTFTVFQDSVPILTDTLSTVSVPTRIGFADGATAASGVSEWKSFSHNASVVPEPSTWAIILGSVGMFAGGRRFGRKNKA